MFSNNSIPFTMNVVPEGSNGGNGNCNGMWGGEGWFIWIILIFVIFNNGWGNGWGGYGGGSGAGTAAGLQEGYVLTSDFAQVDRKLDTITNGICDTAYENARLMNGVTQSIADSNYAIQNAITQTQINAMQNQNALQSQIAACCCDNEAALANLQYNMATQNCATNTAVNTNFSNLRYEMAAQDCQLRQTVNDVGRNLADVQNVNTQAILSAIQSIKEDAKDEKIATLTAQLSDARLIANNNAQTATFTAAINDAVARLTPPAPIPAFNVPSPWIYNGCACYNPCGC